MKKSDIATIVLIAGFATIAAFVLANIFLGDPNNESVKVEYMGVISSAVAEPDPELFNAQAINPTVETWVGKCKDGQTWDDTTDTCIDDTTGDETESGGDDGSDTDTDGDSSTDEDNTDTPDGSDDDSTDPDSPSSSDQTPEESESTE